MTSTLQNQIVKHLMELGTWIPAPELTDRKRWQNQRNFTYYTAQTVGRCLRDTEAPEDKNEESKIAAKKCGKTVQYKYLPPHLRARYIRKSDRTDEKLFRN